MGTENSITGVGQSGSLGYLEQVQGNDTSTQQVDRGSARPIGQPATPPPPIAQPLSPKFRGDAKAAFGSQVSRFGASPVGASPVQVKYQNTVVDHIVAAARSKDGPNAVRGTGFSGFEQAVKFLA